MLLILKNHVYIIEVRRYLHIEGGLNAVFIFLTFFIALPLYISVLILHAVKSKHITDVFYKMCTFYKNRVLHTW